MGNRQEPKTNMNILDDSRQQIYTFEFCGCICISFEQILMFSGNSETVVVAHFTGYVVYNFAILWCIWKQISCRVDSRIVTLVYMKNWDGLICVRGLNPVILFLSTVYISACFTGFFSNTIPPSQAICTYNKYIVLTNPIVFF